MSQDETLKQTKRQWLLTADQATDEELHTLARPSSLPMVEVRGLNQRAKVG